MNRTEELDRLYSLLVALGETRSEPPEPDLMDAFNVVADRHRPAALVAPGDDDYDALLRMVARSLLNLAESATTLGEALDMYDAWKLVTAVIEGRSSR